MNNQQIINKALSILESRLTYSDGAKMSDPETVKQFLKLKLAEYEYEVFSVLYLDSQHQLIKYNELFRGSISSSSVYPREVVKEALTYNASTVIFAHNHPSGICEASQADQQITHKLKSALSLVDIQVLDHIIVGKDCLSFAERGLI